MAKVTRGMKNNNPFNIRKSNNNWFGKILGNDKDFETFDTLVHGYRAGLILLRTYYIKYKLHSIRQIIYRFAPRSENNSKRYVNWLSKNSGVDPDVFVSLDLLLYDIAPLIAYYESKCSIPEPVQEQLIYNVNKEYE